MAGAGPGRAAAGRADRAGYVRTSGQGADRSVPGHQSFSAARWRPDADRGVPRRRADAFARAPARSARRAREAAAGLRSHPPLTRPVRPGAWALEEALAEQRRLAGPDHPEALESLQALGELAHLAGDDERARALLEESLERHRRVYGDAARADRAGAVRHGAGRGRPRHRRGGRAAYRSLDIRRATLGPNHPDVGKAWRRWASTTPAHRTTPARRFSPSGARRVPDAAGPQESDRDHGSQRLRQLAACREFARARPRRCSAKRSISAGGAGARDHDGRQSHQQPRDHAGTVGRHADAERSFRSTFETHRELLGEDHWRTRNVARNVGRVLALQQRYVEALPWMDRATAVRRAPIRRRTPGAGGLRPSARRCSFASAGATRRWRR